MNWLIGAFDLLELFISSRLAYNDSSKKMGNSPGVQVQVPYFGSAKAVSYLDPSLYHPGEYFADMVDALEKIGLEDGVSLRAAPFDFRYAPSMFYLFQSSFQLSLLWFCCTVNVAYV